MSGSVGLCGKKDRRPGRLTDWRCEDLASGPSHYRLCHSPPMKARGLCSSPRGELQEFLGVLDLFERFGKFRDRQWIEIPACLADDLGKAGGARGEHGFT